MIQNQENSLEKEFCGSKNSNRIFSSIKHGLGVTTQLDWITQIPTQKNNNHTITTSGTIKKSKEICSLFHHNNIDKIHRDLASSHHITYDNIHSFEKIILKNKGHLDVTIEIKEANKAQLLIEVEDASSQEIITTGLTFIAGKNTDIQIGINIKNKPDKLHLFKAVCTTKEDAKVLWFTHCKGTKQVILEQKASLVGQGGEIKTISTATLNKDDHFDIATISQHIGQHTKSDIVFKSVVASAKVLARGLVRIEPTAAHSQGYQTSNILLLDKKARAITIPDLEIENKDVMCSHGSTITSIPQDKLFYLRSRGLSETVAKELIIKGFIDDLYSDLNEELTKAIRTEEQGDEE